MHAKNENLRKTMMKNNQNAWQFALPVTKQMDSSKLYQEVRASSTWFVRSHSRSTSSWLMAERWAMSTRKLTRSWKRVRASVTSANQAQGSICLHAVDLEKTQKTLAPSKSIPTASLWNVSRSNEAEGQVTWRTSGTCNAIVKMTVNLCWRLLVEIMLTPNLHVWAVIRSALNLFRM